MSDYLAPLHKDLIKEILRFLKNPNFYAKANLLQAVASFDGQPQGILKVFSKARFNLNCVLILVEFINFQTICCESVRTTQQCTSK